MNNDERLTAFKNALIKDTAAKSKKIETAFEKKTEKLFKIKKSEIDKEYSYILKQKCDEFASGFSKESSQKHDNQRKDLIALRNNIENGIFDIINEKLSEFTKSDVYRDFLLKSYKNVADVYGEPTEVFVRNSDLSLVQGLFPNLSVKEDDGIVIGGIKFMFSNGNILLDDTIDSRFYQEKKNFSLKSKLIID